MGKWYLTNNNVVTTYNTQDIKSIADGGYDM